MLVAKQQQTYENDKKATADRPALYTNQIIQSSKEAKWMGMQWQPWRKQHLPIVHSSVRQMFGKFLQLLLEVTHCHCSSNFRRSKLYTLVVCARILPVLCALVITHNGSTTGAPLVCCRHSPCGDVDMLVLHDSCVFHAGHMACARLYAICT